MQTAIDKIRELRALYEDGLLSRGEFDQRKNAVLDTAYRDERALAAAEPGREGTELGLMAGQELGPPGRRYRLDRLVACGGMGEVWQATDLATEARLGHSSGVALKILSPQWNTGSHHARLLVEEALRARQLAHDHIVRVYDWSHDPASGSTFVIMEYLDGEDLDAVLGREGRMPFERACALLAPVAHALDYAWDRFRLVHRDIKPANLLVLKGGGAKLLDFGIAARAADGAGVEAPGNSGTAAYRAPEANDPQLVPDRGLDVHAVAVMLYQMVEGALPFGANRRERAKPARSAALPAAAWDVLQAGFAADAALRPASVSELLARLQRAASPAPQASKIDSAFAAPPNVRAAPIEPRAPPARAPRPAPAKARPAAAPEREPDTLAEREARKDALRQRLREHVAQEAEQRRRTSGKVPPAGPRTGPQLQDMPLHLAAATVITERRPPARPAPAASSAPDPAPAPARARLRDRFIDNSADGPELVVLAAGRFLMGSSPQERALALEAGARKPWLEREAPQHGVSIERPFAMARHPVTVGQWREFVLANRWKGSGDVNWASPGFKQADEHPVVGVSWEDAQRYVRWLSARTGKRYRLPSEAEWEYACRAGSATPFSCGETIGPGQANYDSRFAWPGGALGVARRGTTATGSYPPNAWGLCDMHGNVWEWVQDTMHADYEGAPVDGSAWEAGGDQARRVLRGGSWLYHPRYLRSAVRNGFAARLSNDKVGFRVVREVG
jgi:formylglycine-generating enzyme required for sulfatase activity